MREITLIGIDLAKNIFRIHAVDKAGKCLVNKNIHRDKLLPFLRQIPPCTVAMEACASSHYWARCIQPLGHTVLLIHPRYVPAYRIGDKNDANDAAAICAASARPDMRFVRIRSQEQTDMQGLHRMREGLVSAKTEACNRIRGLLAENGIIINQGPVNVFTMLPTIIDDPDNGLSTLMRQLLKVQYDHLPGIRERLKEIDAMLQRISKNNDVYSKLIGIPGIGIITATLIASELGNGSAFRNGRSFAAYLGLVPRQHSSGGKNSLYGITKRGNRYIRTLLIHGARTVIQWINTDKSKLQGSHLWQWVKRLIENRGKNKATVALAAKLSRIAWAIIAKEAKFKLELASSR